MKISLRCCLSGVRCSQRYLAFAILLLGLQSLAQAQPRRFVKPGGAGNRSGTDWSNASGDLQAMINASSAGQEVWVAAGTYKPTTGTDRSISFSMKEGVALYGGFVGTETSLTARPRLPLTQPSTSVISGDIGEPGNPNDNTFHLVYNNKNRLTEAAVLDGFVLRDGNSNQAELQAGSGILNDDSSPLIRNCLFTNNRGQASTAGGINPGGTVAFRSADGTLINCNFVGNSALMGGAISINFGNVKATNCSFSHNSAAFNGGSIWIIIGGTLTATNCSFSQNSASYSSVLENEGGTAIFNNCIFWDNLGNEIRNSRSGSVTRVANSITAQGGYAGQNGNSSQDPLFVDAAHDDLRLQGCSPAIDSGDNAANFTPTDLAGNPRLYGGTIDLGAYEFQGATDIPTVQIQARITQLSCNAPSVMLTSNTSRAVDYRWNTGSRQSYTNATEAGVYSLTVTSASGCTRTASVEITGSPLPPPIELTKSGDLSCAHPVVTLRASSLPQATYLFSEGATPIAGTSAATVSSPGTYQVSVTTPGGCVSYAQIEVGGSTAAPQVSIQAPTTTLDCRTSQVTLSATGGSGYQWNTGASGAQVTVQEAGVYSVTVTSPYGCTASSSVTITKDIQTPTAELTASGELSCLNPVVTLRATPVAEASYGFSTGASQVEDSNTARVSQPGTYSVTVTTPNGCTAAASVQVIGNTTIPQAGIQASNTLLDCQTESVTLYAYGANEFRWNTGATTNTLVVSDPGFYSVTVTSETGCSATASVEISQNITPPAVSIQASTTILSCTTSSAELTASEGARYQWSTGAQTRAITLSEAGVYNVIVTGENGCSASASLEIKQDRQDPQITLLQNGPLSASQPTVTLTATEIVGATYVFSAGASPGAAAYTATVSQPGFYTVKATAPNGCTASAQTTVKVDAGTVTSFELINAVSDQVIRALGEDEVINLALLPTTKLTIRAMTAPESVGSVVFNLSGTVNYTKTETGAPYALFGDTQGNYDAWNMPLGNYTLTATPYLEAGGKGLAGTPLTIRFSVVNQPINQLPIARAGADQAVILPASSLVLNGSTSSDPEGEVLTYQWNQQSGPTIASLSSPTAPVMTVGDLVEGTYVFRLTVTDSQGASGFDEVTVQVNAPAGIPRVVSISLINADREGEIKVLKNNEEINLATLVTKNLNLRVNTSPAAVGSVKMVLSGAQSRTQVDNGVPYALFGDSNGNFNSWTPKTGSYSLTVTPYSGPNATGQAGAVFTIAFTVLSQTSTGPGVAGFSLIDAD
ncbi:choice-of-anchor Q domain-containing protein [Larkinella insperata]|uniref:Choice-of-anchor Q domain-containing protein n=1 Tax=Larkinella insperata TaxID=332158 RepID=A0ABW3QI17_9BACT